MFLLRLIRSLRLHLLNRLGLIMAVRSDRFLAIARKFWLPLTLSVLLLL